MSRYSLLLQIYKRFGLCRCLKWNGLFLFCLIVVQYLLSPSVFAAQDVRCAATVACSATPQLERAQVLIYSTTMAVNGHLSTDEQLIVDGEVQIPFLGSISVLLLRRIALLVLLAWLMHVLLILRGTRRRQTIKREEFRTVLVAMQLNREKERQQLTLQNTTPQFLPSSPESSSLGEPSHVSTPNSWSAMEELSITSHIGQRFGNYQLIELLGRGGFAEVYRGEHVHLKMSAAVKVLQMQLDEDTMKDFLAESRTIAGLIHPHIVRVLEFDIRGNISFLAMDYAPGGTLRQRHPKGTCLPLKTIVPYVRQIADALQYAHEKKVVHRDIKPENMLIGRNGEILLSDFGIAVIAHSEHSMTTREMAGTLPYMAPEQIKGKPRPASDQYALGIVLYEWLCGSRPFQGAQWEIIEQHLSIAPPRLRARVPSLPRKVEQVVLKALAKDPLQRFESVQAFADAFERACKGR